MGQAVAVEEADDSALLQIFPELLREEQLERVRLRPLLLALRLVFPVTR